MISNRQLFLQFVAQTSDAPLLLEIERAEGVFMYDASGNKIMDLISGIGVSVVGHRHPEVLKAIKHQLDHYLHLMVYGELVQAPQTILAQNLCATLPAGLNNCYFVNSGSEAVEGAIKLAKRYTGRSEIIYFSKAYHGSTHGALSINGDEFFKRAFRPLLPDTFQIELGLEEDLLKISDKTACVIIETIQGEAGVRFVSSKYYQSLKKICEANGALLICDEIQCGFGRTGKFWAFEHFDFAPDILVCAKGMGGGMPIGAFISSKRIMASLIQDPFLGHITTFGGHPVSCAASNAVIEILQRDGLLSEVEAKSRLFQSRLIHPAIREVRAIGLMLALEFDTFEILKPILHEAISKGVLTDWFLHCNTAMRIAPPLTITLAEINLACDIILTAIEKVHSSL